MYIPYDKITQTIALFLPSKYREGLREFGLNLKVFFNSLYINKNKKSVLKKLRKKAKHQKINVAFYVYDETKWKCQSLYDLFEKSENFAAHIFVTKNAAPVDNFNFQKNEEIKKVFDFFDSQNMRVSYAYDLKNDRYIPFEKMTPEPDIIFYQHPWYVETSQGPVVCSKFALTFYVPYFVATSISPIEYSLRFHQYVQTHYVLNDVIKEYYSKNLPWYTNKGSNLKAVGHTMLDYFYENKDKQFEKKEYVIYAPHWSVDEDNNLCWGTFLQNGQFILDYAKKHREINWVFKPHPCLKSYLVQHKYMTKNEVENYWQSWEDIGTVCETGNYLDMFMCSRAMITDCGSFETEYFLTGKPLIHLKSDNAVPFNPSVQNIVENYYNVTNLSELEQALDNVLIKNNDYLKEKRAAALKQYGYQDNYAAQNILNDIKEVLEID